MEATPHTIYLGVNYYTKVDENLYVVGNIPKLGNWKPQEGFKLNYYDGGNWTNALKLVKKDEIIEYKYVVYNDKQNTTKWEEGPNRLLDLSCLKDSKKEIYNIEVWNHRQVYLRIKYDCGPKESLAICGDLALLGNWKYPSKMNLVLKKDPITREKTSFWEKALNLRPDIAKFKYRFILVNEEEDRTIWEREPDRVCNLNNLTKIASSKKHEAFPNKKDSIKFVRKHNRFIKYDCNFVSKLFYDTITESITIGPYPQSQAEIEYLSQQGIKAVLNLQTRHDMKYRAVDWDMLSQYYYMTNVKAINFAIIDMSPEDIFLKAYDGAVFLNELIEKYKSVYVHCTAGIGRAPHIVAAYLILFKGYKVDDAIAFIKEKRPIAYLNRNVLLKIQSEYFKKIENSAKTINFDEKHSMRKEDIPATQQITIGEQQITSEPAIIHNSLGI